MQPFSSLTYDPAIRELRYVNAGHNSPVLVRGASGEVSRLEAGGIVVGLFSLATYEAQSIILESGNMMT